MNRSSDDYHDESWPQIAPARPRSGSASPRSHEREDETLPDADVVELRVARDRS
ncbi:hypothetical protein [Jatrophihabitans fulvus]